MGGSGGDGRQYPGTNTAVVARVHKGDPLLVLGSSGNWFYVRLPDAAGTEGYVYKDYVDAALLDVTFDEAEDVTDCVGGSAVEEDIPEEIPLEHPTVTEETIPFLPCWRPPKDGMKAPLRRPRY